MEATTAQTFMYWIVGLGALSFTAIALWGVRLVNIKRVAPSKKNPDGMLIMEIWQTGGDRVSFLVRKLPGGDEVEAPKGLDKALRYFYQKSAVGRIMYPSWMPFSFLQVEIAVVSWWENVPSAIDPKREKIKQVIAITEDLKAGSKLEVTIDAVEATQALTADFQKMLQQKGMLGMSDELLRDGEDKLAALSNVIATIRGMKWLPYIATGALIASVAGALLVFQLFQAAGLTL